eukprot:gene4632-5239_t
MNTKTFCVVLHVIIWICGSCDAYDDVITYLGRSRERQSCYTKYSPWNSREKGIIEFSFITSNSDGLLLHVGDSDKLHWTRNYLELRVKHGMLNLISRVKNGSNVMKWKRIWFTKDVDDLRWHKITLRRARMSAHIELDDEKKRVDFGVRGMTPVNLKGVVYIGGFSGGESSTCGSISRSNQFVGAIKNLEYSPLKDTTSVKLLGGQGIIYGYEDHCRNRKTRYFMCQNRGVCINKFNDYRCNCLGTGFEGRKCQIKSTALQLKGLDYLEWKPMRHQHSTQANNLAVRFKTLEPNGILFYIGNSTKYLTVELYNGHLIVGICLNNERITINGSARALNDDKWHLVEVSRREMNIKITINRTHTIQRLIPGRHSNRILNDKSVFIGGQNYLESLHGTISKQYFMGCLQQVYYNGGNIVNNFLPSSILRGRVYGNIVFGCPIRATDVPLTRRARSKYYRPTPLKNTLYETKKAKTQPPLTPVSRGRIDSKSKTFLVVGLVLGGIVLLIIICATIHYLRHRYKREIVLTAVYSKQQVKQGDDGREGSASTSVFISPSSSAGTNSYKSNYFNK